MFLGITRLFEVLFIARKMVEGEIPVFLTFLLFIFSPMCLI